MWHVRTGAERTQKTARGTQCETARTTSRTKRRRSGKSLGAAGSARFPLAPALVATGTAWALLCASSCKSSAEDKSSEPPTCVNGTIACPCLPDATCTQSATKRLSCDRGYCVPDDCLAGKEGCRCYENASCDPHEGVPMTCDGNVCKKTTLPNPGDLNGACPQTGQCGSNNGTPLQCVSGTCQVAHCLSGQPGCPCDVYGQCAAVNGQSMLCNRGLCTPPDCTSGAVGCLCPDAGACAGGAQCNSGICRSAGPALRVTAAGARACDVILMLTDQAGAKAHFDSSVFGETFQRGTRFALSFAAREDKDLSGQLATLERVPAWWGEGVTAFASAPTVERAVCYDRLGIAISEASVDVQ